MAIVAECQDTDIPATLKKFEKYHVLVAVVPRGHIRELYFEQKPEPTPRYLRGTGPG